MIATVRDLEVTFLGNPPVQAVRGVTFQLRPGEFLSIVGASGSGKTSILHVLGALRPPSAGEVEVLGVDLVRATERQRDALRAAGIGFVFQEFHLLSHRWVIDNVAMGGLYRGRTMANRHLAASRAVDSLGIGHLSHSRPSELSGGERQRVAIARALAGDSRLLLCDEPTGNLDSENSRRIVSLLQELRATRGLTVVVATHDREVRAETDRSLVLRDGRIVEQE